MSNSLRPAGKLPLALEMAVCSAWGLAYSTPRLPTLCRLGGSDGGVRRGGGAFRATYPTIV